jgi:hypothetical protein
MATASINIKSVSGTSEMHNVREMELSYTIPELIEENESWSLSTIDEREKEIKAYCKEVSGRKLQKNATPIREGVVNLDENHSMKDLKELAQAIKENHKIDCFQIHIHKDEGVFKDEKGKTIAVRDKHKWRVEKDAKDYFVDTIKEVKELRPDAKMKLNRHAHMVFDWQDKETGKTLKLGRASISQLQDTVAESLKMERGELKVNSNRKRMEPIELKREKELERVQQLQEQSKELQSTVERFEQKKNRASGRNLEVSAEHSKTTQRYREIEQRNEATGKLINSAEQELRELAGEIEKLEAEERELAEAEQGQKSRFKQRKEELAWKGITMDEKTLQEASNELGGAIELQGATAEKLEREIREITEGAEYIEKHKLFQELAREIKRLETETSHIP